MKRHSPPSSFKVDNDNANANTNDDNTVTNDGRIDMANGSNEEKGVGGFFSFNALASPPRHRQNALSEIYRSGRRHSNSYSYSNNNSGSSKSNKRRPFTSSSSSSSSTFEGEELLVKELNQLSFVQREEILDEIHGVTLNEIEETPELVQRALQAMEDEIQKIRKRSAYEKALFVAPRRVKDPEFRLQFLRAVRFDPRPAAQRLVNYYHHKLRLFGCDLLTRKITLDDLSEDDIASINAGSLQFSSKKDSAGRTIATSFAGEESYKENENHHRAVWYLTMSKLEDDIGSQRKGFVAIAYYVGYHLSAKDIEFTTSCSFLNTALPTRYSSIHFCYDNPSLRPLMSAVQLMVGTESRLRFRSHYGSHLECMYALRSYGLPPDALPLNYQYHVEKSFLKEYLKDRRSVEDQRRLEERKKFEQWQDQIELWRRQNGGIDEEGSRAEYPMAKDVVLGRGRPYQEWAGNIDLAIMIDSFREEYKSSDRNRKTQLSHHIVNFVKERGGRFLKRCEDDYGGWIDVSYEVARDKVSHGFRTKTKRNSSPTIEGASASSVPSSRGSSNLWTSFLSRPAQVFSSGPSTMINEPDLSLLSPHSVNIAVPPGKLGGNEDYVYGNNEDFQLFHFEDEDKESSLQEHNKKLKK